MIAAPALDPRLDALLPWIRLAAAVSLEPRAEPQRADPDLPLVERARRGDRRAYNDLFRRHADSVFRWLTRLVGPDPEREDLVQEAFLAAFRGLDRFRGDAVFSTWLYRVTVHVAYGHLRKRGRRPLDIDRAVELLPLDPEASPEAHAAQREQVRRALGFLERLKPKKRIAFVLRVVEGMSLEEIASMVDSNPAAVGQRVKHAQRELSAMIEREALRRAREEAR